MPEFCCSLWSLAWNYTAEATQRSRRKKEKKERRKGWEDEECGEVVSLQGCVLSLPVSSAGVAPSSTSIYRCSAALALEMKVLVYTFLLFWIYEKSKTSFNNHKIPSADRSGHRGSRRLLRCWYLWLCCCCSLLAVWYYLWCWRPGSVWKRVSVYLTCRCRTWEMTWASILTWI